MASGSRGVVLVTGSATGVGRACAVRFAKEGYDVVVNYPDFDQADAEKTAATVESSSRKALLVQCDVSRNEQVVGMIDSIQRSFGRLDVVVNNAGTTHFVDHADLDGMTEEKWDDIFSVNTKGPFFVTRAAARLLKEQEAAAVVNVSSVAGVSGVGSSIAYCASKAALNSITKSLARVLAPKVRVNAVCPGPIDSRWLRRGMSEEEIKAQVAGYPIPRLAQPDDIVDAIVYLAIGTTLTTGQLLVVDGGRTM